METKRLPNPLSYKSNENETKTNEIDENGKVRSFPHERGQWIVHAYFNLDENLNEYFDDLNDLLTENEFINLIDEKHLSLYCGKYITRYHQITSILNELKHKLSKIYSFQLCLSELKILFNEENTRAFISLCTRNNYQKNLVSCKHLLQAIDNVFNEFTRKIVNNGKNSVNNDTNSCINNDNKKNADNNSIDSMNIIDMGVDIKNVNNNDDYDGVSIVGTSDDFVCDVNEKILLHISIAWCLFKHRKQALSLLDKLNENLNEPLIVKIDKVTLKIGNQIHLFKLKEISA